MDIHHIEGQEIHFDHGTEDARHLLTHESGKSEARRYLDEVARHGVANFYIGEHRYIMTKKEIGGKEQIVIERNYHH